MRSGWSFGAIAAQHPSLASDVLGGKGDGLLFYGKSVNGRRDRRTNGGNIDDRGICVSSMSPRQTIVCRDLAVPKSDDRECCCGATSSRKGGWPSQLPWFDE